MSDLKVRPPKKHIVWTANAGLSKRSKGMGAWVNTFGSATGGASVQASAKGRNAWADQLSVRMRYCATVAYVHHTVSPRN